MAQIKTAELEGATLDWAVAKCEKLSPKLLSKFPNGKFGFVYDGNQRMSFQHWAQGGPIIEREELTIINLCPGTWRAISLCGAWWNGKTPLIAAMRCYVASKLGDVVEVPDELVKT